MVKKQGTRWVVENEDLFGFEVIFALSAWEAAKAQDDGRDDTCPCFYSGECRCPPPNRTYSVAKAPSGAFEKHYPCLPWGWVIEGLDWEEYYLGD